MTSQLVRSHLEALVCCDTQNPPRQIDGDSEIFRHCERAVAGRFETRTWDHGDGHVSWYAVRGTPRTLFNVHLDTVPFGEGWVSDPLRLRVEDGRAYGRGVCDIKGAAAVLLALAEQGMNNIALLFTSDEEGAGGCCVGKFLAQGNADRFEQVVVAEPTSCEAVVGHRGFLSVKTRFRGEPGHSSEACALQDSATHAMARWAGAALELAESLKLSSHEPGSCFNLGVIKGGSKSNVIAGQAFCHWSARLRPGESNADFLQRIKACAPEGSRSEWDVPFTGEPLPAGGQSDRESRAFCDRHALPVAGPVDFWTEASLFSAAGLPALVLGPGDIAQAHAVDEWVSLAQLDRAYELYSRMVRNDG